MTYIRRTYQVSKKHDVVIKRTAKKLKISESEVIRRRIPSFNEMIEALSIDMQNAKHIDISKE